jgi:hypothetical protein
MPAPVLLHTAGVFRLEKRPAASGSTPETFLGLQPDAAQALLAGKRCQQLLAAYKAGLHSHLQQQGSEAGGVIDLEVASGLSQAGGLLDHQLQQYSAKVRCKDVLRVTLLHRLWLRCCAFACCSATCYHAAAAEAVQPWTCKTSAKSSGKHTEFSQDPMNVLCLPAALSKLPGLCWSCTG